MTDRELLELAAKAHGGLVYVDDMGWIHEDAVGNRGSWWHPLDDDGDAFRLAVTLDIITLLPSKRDKSKFDTVGAGQAGGSREACFELYHPDPYAATRRAIVRAAAEIGIMK